MLGINMILIEKSLNTDRFRFMLNTLHPKTKKIYERVMNVVLNSSEKLGLNKCIR